MNIQDRPLNVLENRSRYVIADFKEVFANGFIEIAVFSVDLEHGLACKEYATCRFEIALW